MAKKQSNITNKEAIARGKAFYEQLEMKKKGLQQSAAASATSKTPKVSTTKTRSRDLPPRSPAVQRRKDDDEEAKLKGQAFYRELMEKEHLKREGLKNSPVESRSSFRGVPVNSSIQERHRLQHFYKTLQENEDQKKAINFHTTASASSFVPAAQPNVPATVFCGLDAEASSRVQHFYETLSAQEEQKRGHSTESVASSYVDDEPTFGPFMNTRGHPSGRCKNEWATEPLGKVSNVSRQRVIDGLAIFAACFLVKNFSIVIPTLLGNLFLYSFQQINQMAVICGSIALKAFVVSFMTSVFLLVGRVLWKNSLMGSSNEAPKQFYKDIESVKVLVYHELMTQPDVGVTEGSLRDTILARLMGDIIRDRRTTRPWSENEKIYWKESVWSEAVTQLKHEPRILKIKVRVGPGIETIWSWSDVPSNTTRSKKRKVY